eukprot:5521371-Pyramimonas_sp.AAC.1
MGSYDIHAIIRFAMRCGAMVSDDTPGHYYVMMCSGVAALYDMIFHARTLLSDALLSDAMH